MRQSGLRATTGRKFRHTTDSNHRLPVAPNVLDRQFEASGPNEKWVSDITYVWTAEGWLYLAAVEDLYSRKVVGWSLGERLTSELVNEALQMGIGRQLPTVDFWRIRTVAANMPAGVINGCWRRVGSRAA